MGSFSGLRQLPYTDQNSVEYSRRTHCLSLEFFLWSTVSFLLFYPLSSSCLTLPGLRSISSTQEVHWAPSERGEERACKNMRELRKEQLRHNSPRHYTPWARNGARSRKQAPRSWLCLPSQQQPLPKTPTGKEPLKYLGDTCQVSQKQLSLSLALRIQTIPPASTTEQSKEANPNPHKNCFSVHVLSSRAKKNCNFASKICRRHFN